MEAAVQAERSQEAFQNTVNSIMDMPDPSSTIAGSPTAQLAATAIFGASIAGTAGIRGIGGGATGSMGTAIDSHMNAIDYSEVGGALGATTGSGGSGGVTFGGSTGNVEALRGQFDNTYLSLGPVSIDIFKSPSNSTRGITVTVGFGGGASLMNARTNTWINARTNLVIDMGGDILRSGERLTGAPWYAPPPGGR